MSISSINAQAFYEEIARNRTVWTIRDEGGFPAPANREGARAMPFWSSEKRALNIINRAPAYSDFRPFAVDWDTFCDRRVPGLTKDGLVIGVNWTGERATGYDVKPKDVKVNVEAALKVPVVAKRIGALSA